MRRLVPSSLLITLLVITVLVLPLPSIQAASAVTNKFATNLVFDVGQDHYDSHLRANGVYLLPRRQVAIAAIDDVLSPVHQRRLQVVFADLDSVSGTYGNVLEVHEAAYTGTAALRGLSATSFRNAAGGVDGLLAAVDISPNRILITTIDGTSATGGILGTNPVSGISSSELDASVIPAIESGTQAGESRILIAFASTMGTEPSIQTGFLQRTGPALWRFLPRSEFPAWDGILPLCDRVVYEITAAYDPTRQQFTVAWTCGSFGAFARRLNWDATPAGPLFVAHRGPEALHSGSTLSYNQLSDRYMFTFQHNSALMTPTSGGGLSCTVDPSGVGCVTAVPCINTGDHWAAEVDYACGFEFRSGGKLLAPPNEGANYQLVTTREGIICSEPIPALYDWFYESEIWPSSPGNSWDLHEYVRCPASGVTVVIHSFTQLGTETGELRYSFIAESVGFAFDDGPQVFAMDTRHGLLSELRKSGGFEASSCLGHFSDHPALTDAIESLQPPANDSYYFLWRLPGGDFGDSTLPLNPRDLLDQALPCLVACQIDLLAQRLELSGGCVVHPGENLAARVVAEAANIGMTASGSTFVGFYLSTDPTITTGDRLLIGGRDTLPPLDPGTVFSVPTSMTIPDDWPAGPAHLGILVDELDIVSECRETNNVKVIPVSVEP